MDTPRSKEHRYGFTLVELIISLTIVAILVTVPTLAVFNTLRSSRDEKRKSDIQQLQSAIEAYKKENDLYPTTLADIVTSGYLNSIPIDPRDGIAIPGNSGAVFHYHYEPNATSTSYRVYAILEKQTKAAQTIHSIFVGDDKGVHTVETEISDVVTPLPISTPQPINTLFPSNTPRPVPTG
jgi:prepilin-type N-terminal cleavage/methylation domain-containing protein